MKRFEAIAMLLSVLALAGCQTPAPLQTMKQVNLQRFMDDWYVIASIPTFIERDAHNAVESYRLAEDGRVLTDFTFNQGAFDGPRKHYEPVGFVRDASNAQRRRSRRRSSRSPASASRRLACRTASRCCSSITVICRAATTRSCRSR